MLANVFKEIGNLKIHQAQDKKYFDKTYSQSLFSLERSFE